MTINPTGLRGVWILTKYRDLPFFYLQMFNDLSKMVWKTGFWFNLPKFGLTYWGWQRCSPAGSRPTVFLWGAMIYANLDGRAIPWGTWGTILKNAICKFNENLVTVGCLELKWATPCFGLEFFRPCWIQGLTFKYRGHWGLVLKGLNKCFETTRVTRMTGFWTPSGSFFDFGVMTPLFWGFKKTTVLPLSFSGQFIGGGPLK